MDCPDRRGAHVTVSLTPQLEFRVSLLSTRTDCALLISPAPDYWNAPVPFDDDDELHPRRFIPASIAVFETFPPARTWLHNAKLWVAVVCSLFPLAWSATTRPRLPIGTRFPRANGILRELARRTDYACYRTGFRSMESRRLAQLYFDLNTGQ